MKDRFSLASLLVISILAMTPMAAQAETLTLSSSASNSFCVNPTEAAFAPMNPDGSTNYLPVETSHQGPIPDTGAACSPASTTHPTSVVPPAPGWEAPPISGSEWVGLEEEGHGQGVTSYYIYDTTFSLCANQVNGATISGEMYADNVGGVFLNGKSLAFQTEHSSQHNFGSGPPMPFSGSAPFNEGINTLQLVVLDEGGYTGVDFHAIVNTTHPCEHAELGRCVKVPVGAWAEKTCETPTAAPTVGKWEWQPGCLQCGFTSKTTATVISVPASATTVKCQKGIGSGKYSSPAKDEETLILEKCKSSGHPCTSAGQVPGSIKTSALQSELGIVTTEPQVAGLDLEAKTPGQSSAEFNCEGLLVRLSGSVIGAITPFSRMAKSLTVTWKEVADKQVPESFEGAPKDTLTAELNGSAPLAATLTGKDKVTNEEKLEVDIF